MAFVFLRQTGKAFLISVKRLIFFFGVFLEESAGRTVLIAVSALKES